MVITSLDLNFPAQKPPGHVRFVCISDTHTRHRRIAMPPADVLLHTGDFTFSGVEHEIQDFMNWIASTPYQYKLMIPGNHELTLDLPFYQQNAARFHSRKAETLNPLESRFQQHFETLGFKLFDENSQIGERCKAIVLSKREQNVFYLEDEMVTIPGTGIKVYGCPWMPDFHQFAFMMPRNSPELEAKVNQIPTDVDIIMSHGPPHGIGRLDIAAFTQEHVGCELLTQRVMNTNAKVNVFGHIHESFGTCEVNGKTFINASTCTLKYQADNPPVMFDLPVGGAEMDVQP
ncbi:hypothetical protein SmJEL517_g02615 [Synchytrium microbalum]|uniref:Calcineurin-like phosphoesterase domain-containing protein n=1 Tax=Synchytrium microbalum TaxID=1806994 RepID=A0A507CBC9_9FUNG|nr:uncharacterized protein SmJEL517_g02615 [Synchytrium microbalum]TPX34843.1 hypothetical protein SmJEL517_g02615 [Synchytrium microbalum]